MHTEPTTIAAQLGVPPFAAGEIEGGAATRAALRGFAVKCGLTWQAARTASMESLTAAYADPSALAALVGIDSDTARARGIAVAQAPYRPTRESDAAPPRPMPGPLGRASQPAPAIIEARPAPQPAPSASPQNVTEALRILAGAVAAPMDEARVIELIRQHAPQPEPRGLAITINEAPAVVIDNAHAMLPRVLAWIASGASPALVGPAGTGKSELVMQAAKALGRAFHMSGPVDSQYKLSGFMDAHGRYVATEFRKAYEHGGLMLLDDTDRSAPAALNWLNAPLANGVCDFPDGMVRRHPDFVLCLSANTYGRGADRQYVGANQLDAAFLNRFQFLEIDYDEELERRLAGNDAWTRRVQAIRAAARSVQARIIVSMRASIRGAAALAQGIPQADVEAACIWQGIDAATRAKIEAAL